MNKYTYVVSGFAGQALIGAYSNYEKAMAQFESYQNETHDNDCPNCFIEGKVFNEKPHHTQYCCTCGIVEGGEVWQVVIDADLV